MSISTTFFARFFRTNVVLTAFSSYIPALPKNLYEKFVHITLMKLTLGKKRERGKRETVRKKE